MTRLADFDPTIPVIAGCLGKAAMDKQHAEVVAARITKYRATPYRCAVCGQWHIHGGGGIRRERAEPHHSPKYRLTIERATRINI